MRMFAEKPKGNEQAAALPPVVSQALASPGQPLDGASRAAMEPLFGHDFSKVRVHADSSAASSADAVHANAYTVGHHIVFAGKQYPPRDSQGRKLLAHELTHVVQYDRAASGRALNAQSPVSTPQVPAEAEANVVSDNVMSGRNVNVHNAPSALIHRNGTGVPAFLGYDSRSRATTRFSGSPVSPLEPVFPRIGRDLLTPPPVAWPPASGNAPQGFARVSGPSVDHRNYRNLPPPHNAETEAYTNSMHSLHDFMARVFDEHTGSFRRLGSDLRGRFFAIYNPVAQQLLIDIPVNFNFIPGRLGRWRVPAPKPNVQAEREMIDIPWRQSESEEMQRHFLATANEGWTSAGFTFSCQRDWWEFLRAAVRVQFRELRNPDEQQVSITFVQDPWADRSHTAPEWFDAHAEATRTSGDLGSMIINRRDESRTILHESGHIMGLDEEYVESQEEYHMRADPRRQRVSADADVPVRHSALVEREFGHPIIRGTDSGSIMASGHNIRTEHGVAFLERLNGLTSQEVGERGWSFRPKAPRPVPTFFYPTEPRR